MRVRPSLPLVSAICLKLLCCGGLSAVPPSEGEAMMRAFLKAEAIRLDSTFLEGVTNREQWEQRRPRARQEYLEMLGLWPLPERTALNAQVTGVLEREEGFR